MAYSDIDKPSDYFNTKLYTGNGTASQPQTGVGFQPDWVWIKIRSTTGGHGLYDVIRGATKRLRSDSTNAENTATDGLTSFDSDGFTVGNNSSTGTSSATYASWNWLAGGTASSNTDGSITSQVSANTTAGFSIVSYAGNSSNATVGHGLGTTPAMLIFKNRDSAEDWVSWHQGLGGADQRIYLNLTDAKSTAATQWNNTLPTSTVFSLGSSASSNSSGNDFIAYCFAEKKGFSKFGSYTGNGSTDGTFVYLGFRPAWLMFKRTDSTGNWYMYDSKRPGYNDDNLVVAANQNAAEIGGKEIDFLSNGFKWRDTTSNGNASGATYIYMAFASNPFVTSTGVPTTAR